MPYYNHDEPYSYDQPPSPAHALPTFEPSAPLDSTPSWPPYTPAYTTSTSIRLSSLQYHSDPIPYLARSPPSQNFAQLSVGASTSQLASHVVAPPARLHGPAFAGSYDGSPYASVCSIPLPGDFDWGGGWERDARRESSRSLASQPSAVDEEQLDTIAVPERKKSLAVRRRNHRCPHCDKAFTRPSGLAVHQVSHGEEQPFVCPVKSCRRSFNVLSNLRRHQRATSHHNPPSSTSPPPPPVDSSTRCVDKQPGVGFASIQTLDSHYKRV